MSALQRLTCTQPINVNIINLKFGSNIIIDISKLFKTLISQADRQDKFKIPQNT